MAQATATPTTNRLSDLFTDAALRAIFRRAERDLGQAFAVPADRPRTLDGGAAERAGEAAYA